MARGSPSRPPRPLLASAGRPVAGGLAGTLFDKTTSEVARGTHVAAKDNQGLQAIIIVLTLLVIGLGVGLLLVNNAKKTATARADQAEKSQQEAASAERRAQEEANNYKEWMGFGSGESYEALQKSIGEDLERFGSTMPEEERSYRRILEQVFEENRNLALNEAEAKKSVKELQEKMLALEAQKQEQVNQYETKMKESADKLASETNNFKQQYGKVNQEKDKLANDFRKLQETHDENMAQAAQTKAALTKKVADLERSVDLIKRQLPGKDPFAQPADGTVAWVNQREQRVWIDLGSADGLRPQITFSVYAVGQPDAEQAVKKASIEVVRILDDHMAEAKVTGDDNKNPLMPGDKIYSPVWEPGRTVGFAIAGFIDIDGDGKSDLEQLKRIITASGGKVDVAPNNKGEKEGQAQVETRFLILGTRPEDAYRSAWVKSWTEISNEANQLGIETVPLQEFLTLMGWKNDAQVVPLGIDANPDDFAAQPHTQELPRKTGQPAGVFKKRLPKVSY